MLPVALEFDLNLVGHDDLVFNTFQVFEEGQASSCL